MDPEAALREAAEIAREAARLGVADQATLRGLYQEYEGFVRRGVSGSFAQLLRSRGVVDDPTARRLAAGGAPPGLDQLTSRASGVMTLGAPLGERTAPYQVVLDTEQAQSLPDKRTSPFPQVLEPEPLVERTMEFDRVIPSQPQPPASPAVERTMEFDRVIPSQAPPELLLPSDPPELVLPGDEDELVLPDELTLDVPAAAAGPSVNLDGLGLTFDTLSPDEIASTTGLSLIHI